LEIGYLSKGQGIEACDEIDKCQEFDRLYILLQLRAIFAMEGKSVNRIFQTEEGEAQERTH
jgi:hypothetical protein